MIPTENLYLKYLYSTSKTALRDFLDDLGREAEHAVVDDVRGRDRDRGDCDAPADLDAVLKESPNADR